MTEPAAASPTGTGPAATGDLVQELGREYLRLQRRLQAPVEDVWQAVTDPQALSRWIGTWEGDPAEGRVSFTMTAEGEVPPSTYTIHTCRPPSTLEVSTQDEHGTWHLHLDLSGDGDAGGGTTVTFRQRLDDLQALPEIGPGWEWYLDRLSLAVHGQDVSALVWDDYTALDGHYRALLARSE